MLQTLVDMGFSRTMAADALIQTEYDVIRAADWLLSNPLAFVASSSGASVSAGVSLGDRLLKSFCAFIIF